MKIKFHMTAREYLVLVARTSAVAWLKISLILSITFTLYSVISLMITKEFQGTLQPFFSIHPFPILQVAAYIGLSVLIPFLMIFSQVFIIAFIVWFIIFLIIVLRYRNSYDYPVEWMLTKRMVIIKTPFVTSHILWTGIRAVKKRPMYYECSISTPHRVLMLPKSAFPREDLQKKFELLLKTKGFTF